MIIHISGRMRFFDDEYIHDKTVSRCINTQLVLYELLQRAYLESVLGRNVCGGSCWMHSIEKVVREDACYNRLKR